MKISFGRGSERTLEVWRGENKGEREREKEIRRERMLREREKRLKRCDLKSISQPSIEKCTKVWWADFLISPKIIYEINR